MIICRAYKTELDLTPTQIEQCLRYAGTARFAYNWGLRRSITAREAWEALPAETRGPFKRESQYDLEKAWVRARPSEFPWAAEIAACVPAGAFRSLEFAFQAFFRRLKRGEKPGFPRFKSRARGIGAFRMRGSISVPSAGEVKLPVLGVLRVKEQDYLPTEGVKILSASVSERAGRWYVSLQVEQEIPDPQHQAVERVVGIDVGIKSLAVTSDGTVYENPRALAAAQRRLRRVQRKLSRQQKGSANRAKTRTRLAKLHARVSRVRQHALHQVSHEITRDYGVIVLEDLNVSGMLANRTLARAVSDASFSALRAMIEYKAAWRGGRVVLAGRWYPSSKTCSGCGEVRADLTLKERVFRCPACGLEIDRDQNAALNLRVLALQGEEAR